MSPLALSGVNAPLSCDSDASTAKCAVSALSKSVSIILGHIKARYCIQYAKKALGSHCKNFNKTIAETHARTHPHCKYAEFLLGGTGVEIVMMLVCDGGLPRRLSVPL